MKWFLLALATFAAIASGLTSIGPGERAVSRRFGQVVARPGPGLYWARPWGFETVTRVNVAEVRQARVGGDEPTGLVFLTGDENLVACKLTIEYTVGPSDQDLEDFVAADAAVRPRIARHAESLIAEWVAAQTVDFALVEGRMSLANWVSQRLPIWTNRDRLGVTVARVSVESLAAPPEVREAFDAVAQAQNAARTEENQADLSAQARRATAQSFAAKLRAEAGSYRLAEQAAAEAESAAFVTRLPVRQTPDALATIWWAEMGNFLGQLQAEGRVRPLDHRLSPNGLDVTEFVPTTNAPAAGFPRPRP